MLDLFENHIVGFHMRRLISLNSVKKLLFQFCGSQTLVAILCMQKIHLVSAMVNQCIL